MVTVITSVTPVPGKPNLLLGAYDLATLGYGAEDLRLGTASSYASDETRTTPPASWFCLQPTTPSSTAR